VHDDLRTWLIRAGFPGDIPLQEMNRGLGSTALWQFAPAPGMAPLVVRVFGAGSQAVADREARAMTTALDHGVPVPAIVARGDLGDRPLLVTTFIPGVPAAGALTQEPDRAHALGHAMGETLGRINAVTAPDGLYPRADQWIVRGGPALAPIRPLLESLPRQDRLLHLDFHLLNVLVNDGQVSGVIDWENAMAGPPRTIHWSARG
jgi:aminoglycoside phosphotransferase (APT) family kinase protein